ncbi:MAG: RAD55 family ATPase [Candidatus Hodarchaeota archaeon]
MSKHNSSTRAPGVSLLDAVLPEGFPTKAFCIVGGEAGTGKSVLLCELAWRSLERGESALYIILEHDPNALLNRFDSLGWDVRPYLREGKFKIVDCFSYLLDSDPSSSRMRKYFELNKDLEEQVIRVDPTTPRSLLEKIYGVIESYYAHKTQSIVLFDSLTELFEVLSPVDFMATLKNLRAVTTMLATPTIASAHYGVVDKFPSSISYLADGLIDLRFQPVYMQQGILVKQMRIRRLSGVKSFPVWITFDIERSKGMVLTFDYPKAVQEEMQKILLDLGFHVDTKLLSDQEEE